MGDYNDYSDSYDSAHQTDPHRPAQYWRHLDGRTPYDVGLRGVVNDVKSGFKRDAFVGIRDVELVVKGEILALADGTRRAIGGEIAEPDVFVIDCEFKDLTPDSESGWLGGDISWN